MILLYLLGGVILVIAFWLIITFNGLVVLRTRSKEAWADIDVQLKRRYDLIPNLVETVKGYATHERELFEKVTKARAMAMGAGSVQEKAQAENMLSSTLKSLFAVAENYPELKANENFLQLQAQLEGTENRISVERRKFNETVQGYNTTVKRFPNSVFAGLFGFKEKEYFRAVPGSETAPKVEF